MAGKVKGLYKTTIIVWSRYDPSASEMDLNDLVRDATDGEAYCPVLRPSVFVTKPAKDPDWDGTEFFGEAE